MSTRLAKLLDNRVVAGLVFIAGVAVLAGLLFGLVIAGGTFLIAMVW